MDQELQTGYLKAEKEARKKLDEVIKQFESDIYELKKRFLQYPPNLLPALLEVLDIEKMTINYDQLGRCKSIYEAYYDDENNVVTIFRRDD